MNNEEQLWGYFNLPKRPLLFNPIPKNSSLGGKIGDKIIREKFNILNMQTKSNTSYNFSKAFFEANQ